MFFREKQQIVICIIAGAMLGGFVLFRYLPLQRKAKTVEQIRTAQALTIAKASSRSKELSVLKEKLVKLQMAVGNYEANIPSHRDLGAFLQQIANLMNEHNLKEQLIRPSIEIRTDILNCIPVNMQCKGELTQIFEFYKSLQALDRFVRIEQVKLVNGTNFSGELSMQTKAFIYYRSQAGQG